MAGIGMDLIKRLIDSLTPKASYTEERAVGTVTRKDQDGTVWVRLLGADDDTPTVTPSVTVESGDVVDVLIRNKTARIGGNASSPATSTAYVENVRDVANQAVSDAAKAALAASSAQDSADAAAESAEAAQESATPCSSVPSSCHCPLRSRHVAAHGLPPAWAELFPKEIIKYHLGLDVMPIGVAEDTVDRYHCQMNGMRCFCLFYESLAPRLK